MEKKMETSIVGCIPCPNITHLLSQYACKVTTMYLYARGLGQQEMAGYPGLQGHDCPR